MTFWVTLGKTLSYSSPHSAAPVLTAPMFAAHIPSGSQTLPSRPFSAKSQSSQVPYTYQTKEDMLHVLGMPSWGDTVHSYGCAKDVAPFSCPADAVITLNTNGNISKACFRQKHSFRLCCARDQSQFPFPSPLWLFFFSNGAICTGFAKNSFWREIIFPKGTNISLEELNSLRSVLLVGFMFWKPEAFFNSQNRIFPTFHPQIPFSQELLLYYCNILSSLSVRYQQRSVLPSYIKTSIYIFPLEAHGIFTSPTVHPPAAIPALSITLARC